MIEQHRAAVILKPAVLKLLYIYIYNNMRDQKVDLRKNRTIGDCGGTNFAAGTDGPVWKLVRVWGFEPQRVSTRT